MKFLKKFELKKGHEEKYIKIYIFILICILLCVIGYSLSRYIAYSFTISNYIGKF